MAFLPSLPFYSPLFEGPPSPTLSLLTGTCPSQISLRMALNCNIFILRFNADEEDRGMRIRGAQTTLSIVIQNYQQTVSPTLGLTRGPGFEVGSLGGASLL